MFKYEWQLHLFYILVAMVLGCLLLGWLMESDIVSVKLGVAWSIVLSALAVFYVALGVRRIEMQAVRTAERLRAAGYEVDKTEDAFIQFMVDLKPYYDVLKGHEIVNRKRVKRALDLFEIVLNRFDKLSDQQLGQLIGKTFVEIKEKKQ